MLTPRNNLSVKLRPTDTAMADEVDTVYEVASVEIGNTERTYKQAMQIIQRSLTSEKAVASLKDIFVPAVLSIAKRDGLMAGVPHENIESVAMRIAQDWDKTCGHDYRCSKDSGPAL